MDPLISAETLGQALKITIPEGDEYAALILDEASNAVRDYAGKPLWVATLSSPPVDGEELAPAGARSVTLWVAVRAFTNPRNLSRRTSGPISESFENGLFTLELNPSEKERIDGLVGSSGSGGGLWFLPQAGVAADPQPVLVPTSVAPGAEPFLMYPMQIATDDQLPWTTNPPADGGDLTYG